MRAAVLTEVGGPLRLEEIPRPSPKAGEVLVQVTACGVCHTDLHVIKGEVKFPMPCVLGHEISGIVEAVAPDVRTTRPGAAVVCSFIMPCGAVLLLHTWSRRSVRDLLCHEPSAGHAL